MGKSFYVGSYAREDEESILCLSADFNARAFTKLLGHTGAFCPSYVLPHPSGHLLYAVRELTEEGAIETFGLTGGGLTLLDTRPTLGRDPCFLSLDAGGRFLVAVNYSGSSFTVFRLGAHGVPAETAECRRHTGSGPNPSRQEAAHPHCAVFHGGALYVCDLGLDRLFVYRMDGESGRLTEERRIELPPASGPRHLCFSAAAPGVLYVSCELSSTVCVLRLNGKGAELIQEISALPADFDGVSTLAAIRLSADGGSLFVSNRGDDSIAMFRVLPDGRLRLADICKTGGKTPRDFDVFGSHLVVANQDSDSITVLDYDSGSLRQSSMTLKVTKPTCIMKLREGDGYVY